MAVIAPLFEDNFEDGTSDAWDIADSDNSNQMDFPHYSVLARTSGLPMPYSGAAYCMRVVLATGNTDDATIGDGDINITDGQTIWCRFNLFLGNDLITTGIADVMSLIQFQKVDNVSVFAWGIRIAASSATTADWSAGTTVPSFHTAGVVKGKWLTVDMKINVQTAAASGELESYVTEEGQEPSSTVTRSLTGVQASGAVTHIIIGPQDKLTATSGTILIDNFIATVNGGSRFFPEKNRFSTTKVLTKSGHVFVGPGTIKRLTAVDTGTGDVVVEIFDTDTAQAYMSNKKVTLAPLTSETITMNDSIEVIRGCYVQIAGTDPEATLEFNRAPNWFSDGNIRQYAHRRSLTS